MRIPRTLSDHKRLAAAGTVIVLAAIGVTVWQTTKSSSSTTATATTSLVTAATSTLQQTVSTTGTIAPATESDLSFTVSGTVNSVSATVGKKVAKGAVLATVGTTDLQAAVDAAQATLDAANINYASLVAADDTATQLASGKAQIASATSALATAKKSLAAATLTSPIAGTVASVGLATGDQVGSSGGSTSGSASSAGSGTGATTGTAASTTSSSSDIVVISTSSWVVNATVGSADLASVKAGLQAQITPTDATTKIFGVVKSVGIVASSSTSGSATFPVAITVTGSPTGLYSGASADVVLVVKQLTNVLTVPTAAVHTVNGKTVVYQKKNGAQVNTPVTIGTVFGASSQILSGIKAGDQVITTTFGPGAGVRGGTTTRTGGTGEGGTGGTGGTGGFGGGAGGAGGFGGGAGGFGTGGN